ncbi:protein tyrosine phosphatase, putative [Plasmodium vinckei brucechwatti]|uniref:protein-tyrosine-phosphatase n=1 Tax=Plasmodium vinckei brucechwatti TaxID=119398 RepID=A0A6V7SP37_PLAVN|nr:protein tyrosine phosphatase, putative [Plasmodium vinckei brucechwatti]
MIQILPFLYMGKLNDIKVLDLKKYNIKALVVCCTYLEYPQDKIPKGYDGLRINLEDMGLEQISKYFDESNNFIHSFVTKNQPVFVTCSHGISRSPTIVLAYLIGKQNYFLNEAFRFLMSKKNICPNVGFAEQLCNYEESIKNKITFCSKKYADWYSSDMCYNNVIIDFSPE